jgi:hypothetical protein
VNIYLLAKKQRIGNYKKNALVEKWGPLLHDVLDKYVYPASCMAT